METQRITSWITDWEGYSERVYTDAQGHPTVGIGFQLDKEGAQQKIESLGLNYQAVVEGTQSLNDDQIKQLLNADIATATKEVQELVSNFDDLPEDRQEILVDLVLEIGEAELSNHSDFVEAVESKDWELAAEIIKNTHWYEEAGLRAHSIVNVLKDGLPEPSTLYNNASAFDLTEPSYNREDPFFKGLTMYESMQKSARVEGEINDLQSQIEALKEHDSDSKFSILDFGNTIELNEENTRHGDNIFSLDEKHLFQSTGEFNLLEPISDGTIPDFDNLIEVQSDSENNTIQGQLVDYEQKSTTESTDDNQKGLSNTDFVPIQYGLMEQVNDEAFPFIDYHKETYQENNDHQLLNSELQTHIGTDVHDGIFNHNANIYGDDKINDFSDNSSGFDHNNTSIL